MSCVSRLPDQLKKLDIKINIGRLFHLYGKNKYDSDISYLEHALQSASDAELNGYEPPMIIAALVHNIGHLVIEAEKDSCIIFEDMSIKNKKNHDYENYGVEYLKDLGFNSRVLDLILGSIDSRRYLSRDDGYYKNLSDQEKNILQIQGGPMNDQEKNIYLENKDYSLYIALRFFVSSTHMVGRKTKELEYYLSFLDRC